MSGVGQFKDGLSENLTGCLWAEADGLVAGRRDDGKLLDDEEIQSLPLDFLARHKVQNYRVKIRSQ